MSYLLPNNHRVDLTEMTKLLRAQYGALILDYAASKDGVVIETQNEVEPGHQKTFNLIPYPLAA